jgi:hypothetical protein
VNVSYLLCVCNIMKIIHVTIDNKHEEIVIINDFRGI